MTVSAGAEVEAPGCSTERLYPHLPTRVFSLQELLQAKQDLQHLLIAKEEQEDLLRKRERELTALKGALKFETSHVGGARTLWKALSSLGGRRFSTFMVQPEGPIHHLRPLRASTVTRQPAPLPSAPISTSQLSSRPKLVQKRLPGWQVGTKGLGLV